MTLRPIFSIEVVVILALVALGLVVWGRRRAPRQPKRVFARRTLLAVATTLIMLGPSVPAEETQVTSNVEVYFVIDRTGSMAAEDWNGDSPRLDGVRSDLDGLITALASSRFSVITWDSSARVELPLTTDSSSARSLADSLHQEVTEFSAGSSINRPLQTLADTLEEAAELRPGNVRYVFFFTDGESTDPDDPGVSEEWESVASYIDGGAVFGYGTEEGGRMKVYQVGGEETDEYITDDSQAGSPEAISTIDEDNLTALAESLGLDYQHRTEPTDLSSLGTDLMADATVIAEERDTVDTYRYVLWPLALVAAALLVWEASALAARVHYLRRADAI